MISFNYYNFFTGLSIPRISRDRNIPSTSLFQKILKDRTVQRIFKNLPNFSLGNGRRITNSRPTHPIKGIFFKSCSYVSSSYNFSQFYQFFLNYCATFFPNISLYMGTYGAQLFALWVSGETDKFAVKTFSHLHLPFDVNKHVCHNKRNSLRSVY